MFCRMYPVKYTIIHEFGEAPVVLRKEPFIRPTMACMAGTALFIWSDLQPNYRSLHLQNLQSYHPLHFLTMTMYSGHDHM